MQTEVSELSSSLRHLQTGERGHASSCLAISPVATQRITGTILHYICTNTNVTVAVTMTDYVLRLFFKVKLCKKKLKFSYF